VRSIIDDGFVFGPPEVVFKAIKKFERGVRANTGGELQADKSEWCSQDVTEDNTRYNGIDTLGFKKRNGFLIGGAPIGTEEFITTFYENKKTETTKAIDILANQLSPVSLHCSHAMLVWSSQVRMDFYMRHSLPSHVRPMAEAVYETILHNASRIFDADLSDPITSERIQLPARFGGCNLLSQGYRVDMAFVGSINVTVPVLCDTWDKYGGREVGFADIPDIKAVVGSFDEDVEHPFSTFSQAALPMCTQARGAYERVRQDQDTRLVVNHTYLPRPPGPMESPSLGEMEPGIDKCQREITHQSAKIRSVELQRKIFSLPKNDPRRMAYLATDSLTKQKVSAMPTGKSYVQSNELYRTMWQIALGLKLTICRGLVQRNATLRQKKVGGSFQRAVDAYGITIANATFKGNGWTRKHDSLLWTLERMIRAAGIEVKSEVVGILRGTIPQIDQLRRLHSYQSVRNIIPDLFVVIPSERNGDPAERFLLDLKCMNHGGEKYRVRAKHPNAPDGIQIPKFGVTVAKREERVPMEYKKHAAKIERELHLQQDANGIGPVQKELDRYTLRGMVVGGYGEASPMLHRLLQYIARGLALKNYQRLGFENAREARSVCSSKVMRDFAAAAAVEQASMIHDRVDRLELKQMPSYGLNAEAPGVYEANYHQQDDFTP
jgi:hypothetical protein